MKTYVIKAEDVKPSDCMIITGVSVRVRHCYYRRIETDWFNIDVHSCKREGVHHNALDDCLHQIKYMCGGSK